MLTPSAGPSSEHFTIGSGWRRPSVRHVLPLALVVIAAAAVFAMGWHRELSLEALVQHRAAVDRFIAAYGVLAVLAYVAAVALAVSGGLLVTVIGGFLFGAVVGALGGIVGATVGAAAIFVLAKTAFGGWLSGATGSIGARLAKGFRDDAFNYVVFLRMTPVPFQVVNLVPAVLNVPLTTFSLATALGVIPTRLVFAAFGAGLDAVLAPQIGAFDACRAAGGTGCRLEVDLDAVLTPGFIALLAVLCVAALVPVGLRRWHGAARAASAAARADR